MSGEELHAVLCDDMPDCRRWRAPDGRHRRYYDGKATALTDRLAPEIGAANVKLAVSAVLEELL